MADHYPPDHHAENATLAEIHLTHCVNSIRQSLQCGADISTVPLSYQLIPAINTRPKNLPRFDIVHSCRNFKKIREWTIEHSSNEFLDDE